MILRRTKATTRSLSRLSLAHLRQSLPLQKRFLCIHYGFPPPAIQGLTVINKVSLAGWLFVVWTSLQLD